MTDRSDLVHLITVSGSFEAGVITAHLAAEGVLSEMRGMADGPYRMSVGPMANVEIFVHADDLEFAKRVIASVDDPGGDASGEDDTAPTGPSGDDDVVDLADHLDEVRAQIFEDPSIPIPPAPVWEFDDDTDEMSEALSRSARPDTRPSGPAPQPRLRRAIN